MKNFSKNLKKIRKEKKMSQRQLATRADLSAAYVNQLESKARNNPQVPTIEALAKALGVSITDLMS